MSRFLARLRDVFYLGDPGLPIGDLEPETTSVDPRTVELESAAAATMRVVGREMDRTYQGAPPFTCPWCGQRLITSWEDFAVHQVQCETRPGLRAERSAR